MGWFCPWERTAWYCMLRIGGVTDVPLLRDGFPILILVAFFYSHFKPSIFLVIPETVHTHKKKLLADIQ